MKTLALPNESLYYALQNAQTQDEVRQLVKQISLVTDAGTEERDELCMIAAAQQIRLFNDDLLRRN